MRQRRTAVRTLQARKERNPTAQRVETKKQARMTQKYLSKSWLTPCSLRSHRIANSSPKNGLRHFSALPTHHPAGGGKKTENYKKNITFAPINF